MRDRVPDLKMLEIDSKFIFIADLWAEIYKYLFWLPYQPPSWKFTFPIYCQHKGSIPWFWSYRNRLSISFV